MDVEEIKQDKITSARETVISSEKFNKPHQVPNSAMRDLRVHFDQIRVSNHNSTTLNNRLDASVASPQSPNIFNLAKTSPLTSPALKKNFKSPSERVTDQAILNSFSKPENASTVEQR
jgi:hypothetical protein